ncbi:MAG: phosphate signaling complex protein PhoU [Candidatus Hydrogenedentes bacterium]|nr:phosphate signaling complex protein PhoU [Candidatus Hydrogenedentota bacterium]
MSAHLERAIERLKKRILVLSARVEETLRSAVRSVEQRDAALARQVVDGDYEIDKEEVDIEEECLKMLALYQPVAVDLRLVVTVLKINGVLERIGDLAVNIAERSVFLATQPPPKIYFDFPAMAQKTQAMVGKSLDALVRLDPELAREVSRADDEVDAMNREMYTQTKEGIRAHIEDLDTYIHLLSISRHLERTADLATSIADDVVYLVEGEIVRHRTENYHAHSGDGDARP